MGNGLAGRVKDNAAANGQPTVFSLINQQKDEIARALPAMIDPDRFTRIAITVIRSNKKLAACNPMSLVGALMTCAQLGLEPGPLGEAYLVPYGTEVTFIPGYRGLIKLAWQSGQLEMIDAHVVYEHDTFTYEFGLDAQLVHKPTLADRGSPIAVYAVAKFKNGGHAFEVMSVDDVEKIRARSKAAKNGPWVSDWDAMAKKTVIKQLAKFLPLSTEMRGMAQAVALDGTTRTDYATNVDFLVPAEQEDGHAIEGTVVQTDAGHVDPETGELTPTFDGPEAGE